MICLVNMPGAEVTRPSLALGLLTAILGRAGRPVRNVHANLDWFARLGPELHEDLIGTAPSDMVIEWIFAGAAFPEAPSDARAFAELTRRRDARLQARPLEELASALAALRSDASAFVAELAERVLASGPRVVGCTSMFQQHTASLALLRAVKALDPGVVTLLGGANCEAEMGLATHRNCGWVDFVVSGEADELIVDLVALIERHGASVPLEQAPAAVLCPGHRREGYPAGSVARAVVERLDPIPAPDYDDYFAQLRACAVGGMVVPGLPFETSRGCWWGQRHHCTFCGLNGSGMNFRVRSAETALAQVRSLEQRYGVRRLEAVDNILSMGFFDTVLPALRDDGVTRYLFYETKANLRREQVELLAAAGVGWIQPGIESLDTRILGLMRKGTTALQNVRLLRDCAQFGVHVIWSIIAGFPREEDAWYAEMAAVVPALRHLSPGGLAGLRFDRFSPYHREPDAWGLELEPAAPYAHVFPFSGQDLAAQAYYFDAPRSGELVGDLRRRGLSSRPGVAALRDAFGGWHEASERGARLDAEVEGDRWVVFDSRFDAAGRTFVVDGVDGRVLTLVEPGVSTERVLAAAGGQGIDEPAVHRSLERLVALRCVVALDGRWLGVVLRRPLGEPPPRICFPGGTLLRPEFVFGD